MDKQLQEYAQIKKQIKELQDKEALLKAEIVQEMQDSETHKIENDFGRFTLGSRKSWQYSPKVDALAEKLKIAQYKEQERGVASIKNVTYYITYKG